MDLVANKGKYLKTLCRFIRTHKAKDCKLRSICKVADEWKLCLFFFLFFFLGLFLSPAQHQLPLSPSSPLQDDCLVKVWYSTSKWKFGVSRLFTPPDPSGGSGEGELAFSFVYLAHPRSVTGLSWRKTSKYMPRYGRHLSQKTASKAPNFAKFAQ